MYSYFFAGYTNAFIYKNRYLYYRKDLNSIHYLTYFQKLQYATVNTRS